MYSGNTLFRPGLRAIQPESLCDGEHQTTRAAEFSDSGGLRHHQRTSGDFTIMHSWVREFEFSHYCDVLQSKFRHHDHVLHGEWDDASDEWDWNCVQFGHRAFRDQRQHHNKFHHRKAQPGCRNQRSERQQSQLLRRLHHQRGIACAYILSCCRNLRYIAVGCHLGFDVRHNYLLHH